MSNNVTSVRSTPVATAEPAGSGTTTDAALLPDADSLSSAGIDDALGGLYMAMAQQADNTHAGR